MTITLESVLQSEYNNRQRYVDNRNIQQAKLSNMFEKTGCYSRKSGRVKAIQYWIDYWKGWIELSDIKIKMLREAINKHGQ